MKKKALTTFHTYVIFIITCLPACVHKSQVDKHKLYFNHPINALMKTSRTPPPITIWVHGTLMFRTPSYHYIFNKKSSLVKATTLPHNNHFRILAETIANQDSERFPLEEFYIFSWSGRLANKERKDAAEKLYQEIIKLSQEYKHKYDCLPTIRIFAHSHGGNVVLNMALLSNLAQIPAIKSLILLACPVQDETMHLINTSLFERVYSLYSSFDMIQILAPQFKRIKFSKTPHTRVKNHSRILPFSARLFPHYTHLTQTKIKINNYPISHTAFSRKEFVILIPTILNKLDEWHNHPNHSNNHKLKLLCIYTNKSNLTQ